MGMSAAIHLELSQWMAGAATPRQRQDQGIGIEDKAGPRQGQGSRIPALRQPHGEAAAMRTSLHGALGTLNLRSFSSLQACANLFSFRIVGCENATYHIHANM